MEANEVGYRYQLRAGEDQDCDEDDCKKRAVVRITEKSGIGISYGFYCKACAPDPVASTPAPAVNTRGIQTA